MSARARKRERQKGRSIRWSKRSGIWKRRARSVEAAAATARVEEGGVVGVEERVVLVECEMAMRE